MTNRIARMAAMTAAFFAWAASAACAEPLEATFALTVNPLNGHHEINGGTIDRLTFAPLPLGELTLRRNGESIRIEGLPAVTFAYGSAGDGAQSTRLSIVNATYRHAFPNGYFAGIGQTVYNQFTTYSPVNGSFYYARGFSVDPINGSEAQYSRVTGLRLEAGRTVALGRDRLEYSAAANPRMHGVQYTRIPTFNYYCPLATGVTGPVFGGGPTAPSGCAQVVRTFSDPEKATQVDFAARVAHRVTKNIELLYGLRYLNYNANYDDFPGQLADRNVGFAPTIGFRVRL